MDGCIIGQKPLAIVGDTAIPSSDVEQMVQNRNEADISKRKIYVVTKLRKTAVYDEYVRWCGRSEFLKELLLPDAKPTSLTCNTLEFVYKSPQ